VYKFILEFEPLALIWNGIVEKKWNIIWLVGKGFIYLREVGLLLLKKKKKNSPSNFCTYSLSLFPMHVGMAKRLEKLGDFLWGGIGDKFKPHLFKWLRI